MEDAIVGGNHTGLPPTMHPPAQSSILSAEREDSHSIRTGQRCLAAWDPAIALMCPPGSSITCLSVLETRSLRTVTEDGGQMGSSLAATISKGQAMRERSTLSPSMSNLPCTR